MNPKINEMSDFKFALLVIVVSAIVMILINKIFHVSFFQGNTGDYTGDQYSGVAYTGSFGTGYICDGVENCITDLSGNKIEIPEDPRAYIDYVKKTGKPGIDYFIIQPNPQPIIRSKDKNQNNDVMYKYFATNRPTINLTKPVSGYIMFVTNTAIPDNRDLFLGINGGSLGQILRNNSRALPVFNENEYLYNFDAIPLALGTRNLNNYISSGKLVINGFVGESGNGVKEIWIVIKK